MTDPRDDEDEAWRRAQGDDADRFEKLQKDLASLETSPPAPQAWKKRVAQQVGVELAASSRPPGRALRWAGFGLAAAALLLAVLYFSTRTPESIEGELALVSEIRRTNEPRRGEAVAVGDTIVVVGTTTGTMPVEVWLYRPNDSLAARCPSDARCEPVSEKGRGFRLTVELDEPGAWEMLVVSGSALPTPGLSLDGDFEAATRSGAKVLRGRAALLQ